LKFSGHTYCSTHFCCTFMFIGVLHWWGKTFK